MLNNSRVGGRLDDVQVRTLKLALVSVPLAALLFNGNLGERSALRTAQGSTESDPSRATRSQTDLAELEKVIRNLISQLRDTCSVEEIHWAVHEWATDDTLRRLSTAVPLVDLEPISLDQALAGLDDGEHALGPEIGRLLRLAIELPLRLVAQGVSLDESSEREISLPLRVRLFEGLAGIISAAALMEEDELHPRAATALGDCARDGLKSYLALLGGVLQSSPADEDIRERLLAEGVVPVDRFETERRWQVVELALMEATS